MYISWLRLFRSALFLAAISGLEAQTTYNYIDLRHVLPGVPPGGGGFPVGINNLGHVFLNTNHAYMYANGAVSQIPETFGLTNLSVSGFNNRDEVVGWGTAADGTRHTYYYNFGTSTGLLREFSTPQMSENFLVINDFGQVAVGDFGGTAVITRVYDGDNIIIPPTRFAMGINNNGDLLESGPGGLYLYNIRTGISSASTGLSVTGMVFGDNGWVGGSTPFSILRAKLGGFPPAPPEEVGSWRYTLFASAINGSGVMVGSLWDALLEPFHPFVSFGGGAVDLNTLTTVPDDLELFTAQDINDEDDIVGFARNLSGFVAYPYLLEPTGVVPIPEPSAYGLFGAGLLLCALSLRSRKR